MNGKRFTAEQVVNKPREADVLIEASHVHYNAVRPHSALGLPATGPGRDCAAGRLGIKSSSV